MCQVILFKGRRVGPARVQGDCEEDHEDRCQSELELDLSPQWHICKIQ
jgi:hypothetical protein